MTLNTSARRRHRSTARRFAPWAMLAAAACTTSAPDESEWTPRSHDAGAPDRVDAGTMNSAPDAAVMDPPDVDEEDAGTAVDAQASDDDAVPEEPPAGFDGVDLCEEGLRDGDVINGHLDAHVTDGATVAVCRGTYVLQSTTLDGNGWTLIAPRGATLEIRGNVTLRFRGTGFRLSGFIFDQRGDAAKLHINPVGNDWQLDHVAWWGEHPGGSYLMTPAVLDVDSSALIDRMYMGDGQRAGTKSGGIWVNANAPHRGTLTLRRVHIAHMIDNGMYGSGPPTQGHPGRTNVEDSFFLSNTISNARTGALGGRETHVEGSVFVLDDSTRPCGTGCSSPGARTTRAVWAWYGPVRVEDNDFTIEHGQKFATSRGGTIIDRDNREGAEARTEPPDGVLTAASDIYETPPGWPR